MLFSKTTPLVLGNYIKFFYSFTAKSIEVEGLRHRRLPDGTLDVVFNLGSPAWQSGRNASAEKMPKIVVTGLYAAENYIQYTGDVHFIGAVFQPGAAHLFVNDNLAQFRQCAYAAENIFGNSIYNLLEQMHITGTEPEKHQLLESYLIGQLRKMKDRYAFDKILMAVRQIDTLHGNIKMPDLYLNIYMGERHFRRIFDEYVGMNAKQYAGIIRLTSYSRLHQDYGKKPAALLYKLGFTDHSHLNKEFQRIAGTSPKNFFSEHNQTRIYSHLV